MCKGNNMSNVLFLWAVTALHGGQMVISAYNNQWPMTLMMFGFTIADLGILWVSQKGL